MAGVYPDIPGTRFALDLDGTVMKWRDLTAGGAWNDVSSSIVNTQAVTTSNYIACTTASRGGSSQITVAFPEARSLNGVYLHAGTDNKESTVVSAWSYSTDTTDGTDGTWTNFSVVFNDYTSHDNATESSKPYYRSDIAPMSLTNVKGLRVNIAMNDTFASYTSQIYTLHLYGSRPATGVDRLAFWHPTLDQVIDPAALDFGDIPQGTSNTLEFRVKNLSSSKQANGVSVDISDIKPEYDSGNMQLSTDNNTFASSLNLGNMTAGAVSAIVYVRRTVPSTQDPGLRFARLIADATSWS